MSTDAEPSRTTLSPEQAQRIAYVYSTLVPEDIDVDELAQVVLRENLLSPEEVHAYLPSSPEDYSRVLAEGY